MKVLIIYALSIICGAIADGLNERSKILLGHLFEPLEKGLLILSPFIFNYDGGLGWYIATYLCLRIALFDYLHNLAKGDAFFYHGTSDLWGKFLHLIKPPVWAELFGRIIFLVAGIMIPIQNIN